MESSNAVNQPRPRRRLSLLHVLSAAVVLVGIALYGLPRWDGGPSRPNVILISIDTCRADYLSCYRPDRATTPHIDALAGHATLFENAVSPVPITLPAHCSMLTGLIPPVHGVRNQPGYALPAVIPTLPEILRTKGYQTGAIVSSYVMDHGNGLAQGFDTYNDDFRDGRSHGWGNERVGDKTSAAAVEWLGQHADGEPFFLFLHYYDPHLPYEPPEPFAGQFPDDPYAGEVAFTDHCIGTVLAELKALGLYDDALIIITADHGEMLGEHGEESHQFFIYESAIKVPLLIKLPGQRDPRRVEEVVGLVDIVPTVCGLTGSGRGLWEGQDLTAMLTDGPARPRRGRRYVYTESTTPLSYGANPLLGQVGRQWKYIQTTRPELYDLLADPGETQNLVADRPHIARDLQIRVEELTGTVADGGSDREAEISDEQRERLESLGYVGDTATAGPAVFDPTREDPKDLIDVHIAFQRTLELDDVQAEALIREFLAERPKTRIFRLALGRRLRKQQRHDEAVEQFTTLIDYFPGEGIPYVERGLVRELMGDTTDAARDFRQAQTLLPATSPWNTKCARALRRIAELPEN